MKEILIPLSQLPVGSFGIVKKVTAKGLARRRLFDLGFIEQTMLESLRKSPAGDPTAYEIRGAVIALRKEEAAVILVELIHVHTNP